jgi:Ca2+-binding RTX toxin-like protein
VVTLTITNFVDVSNGWYFTPFEWLEYHPERVRMDYSASKVTAYWMEGFAFDHFTEFTGEFTYRSDGSLDYANSRITGITIGKTLDNVLGNTSDVQYSITGANFVLADALAFGNERYYTKLLSGNDLFFGNDWGNIINGYSGNDRIRGNAGNDMLSGGAGNDTLVGGTGADRLIGGTGRDVFDFDVATESTPVARDVLRAGGGATAFEAPGGTLGDLIDLSTIDANTGLSGNQEFGFGTSMTAGRLWAVDVGTITVLRGNVDADATVEFEVAIEDGTVLARAYTAGDFIL